MFHIIITVKIVKSKLLWFRFFELEGMGGFEVFVNKIDGTGCVAGEGTDFTAIIEQG